MKGKYKAITRIVILLLAGITLSRCAQESTPQGGAKDEKPPELKHSSPPNKSTHFATDKIKITFNEFIKETGFPQTLVSPPLDKRPVYHVEGRTLTIKLKSALRDSTTYTINFGDDLQDLNESNKAPNFTYVFSTGSYIDSQRIDGTVILAKDNTPAEDIVVSLYPKDSVDGILKSKPYYFAKTDKAGNFKIENIKAAQYRLYALKDQNYNYIYDQPNELIAFSDTLINLADTLPKNVKLHLFNENRQTLKFSEAKLVSPGQLQIIYNKPVNNFKLDWKGYSADDFAYTYPTNDTIIYWYSKYYAEKDTFYLTANDTLLDTVRMELKSIKKDSLATGNKLPFTFANQAVTSRKDTAKVQNLVLQELLKPLKITFTVPIIGINDSKRLQISRDSSLENINAKVVLDPKTKQSITVEFDKQEKTTYNITIPDSMYKDIFGRWNSKLVQRITTNDKTSYGNLQIKLKTEHPDKYYVIKLLHAESNEVVKEFYFTGNGEKKITVSDVLAGKYKFMVIEDENKNGEWDTGNFEKKIQPENIYTYQDTYELKGGWDLDVEVKF